jgi:hypothetical protein
MKLAQNLKASKLCIYKIYFSLVNLEKPEKDWSIFLPIHPSTDLTHKPVSGVGSIATSKA